MPGAFSHNADTLVELEAASMNFGGGTGVFDLNFSVASGTILGMIGPSGCGKTTTMRLLMGIYQPTEGQVRVFGIDPSQFSDHEKVRIGYIPQHFILYPDLSTEENLHFVGGLYGLSPTIRQTRINQLLDLVELKDARKRLGRQLSGGMQRRVMLAGALIHEPQLIFADEPTAGIDPILRAKIWSYFRKLRNDNRTIIITTQYVGEAAYCDLVAVMHQGRLIALNTPEGLRHQAMGGDVIHIQVDDMNIFHVMEFLSNIPEVKKVEAAEGESHGIFVFVNKANRELPYLLTAMREELNIIPKMAEPYLPPFDDVFVRLIEKVMAA